MVTYYTTEDLCAKISSGNPEQYKVACWAITVGAHRFSQTDLEQIISVFIHSPLIRSTACTNWNCSLILHVMPRITEEALKNQLSDLLVSFLDMEEGSISYAAETIARANYLLSRSALDTACDFLQKCDCSTYSFGTIQNLILMGWGILDFVSEHRQAQLIACCKAHEAILQLELRNDLSRVKTEGIVFYVADYLSGKSFLQPPTAEIYATTFLREAGFSASIFDNRLYHISMDHFIRLLRKTDVETIVVDTTPYDQVSIYYVDYRLDRIIHDIKVLIDAGYNVICVGSHATVRAEEFMKLTGVRYAIKGEMELSLLNLAQKTNGLRDLSEASCSTAKNLYLYNGTSIRYTGDDEQLLRPDISTFPMPDYDLVDMSGYYGDEYIDNNHKIKAAWSAILAQRGCPFQCAFCYHFFGNHVRKRTPQQVVDEMELLETKYHVDQFFFIDHTFTLDKQWVREVCRLITDRKLTISWNCETRVDCLDEDLLQCMKDANCKRIWLGVESFNNKLLTSAQKGTTEEQTKSMIQKILASGIKVSCFLMIGLPGENTQTIQRTLRSIQESGIEYTKSIITFIPRDGTPLFEMVANEVAEPSFRDMNRYKGLLENEISELDIIKTIEQMSMRNVNQWEGLEDDGNSA